jgi:phosphopantothenoylcysteine decarboxylase/phosphopantothenate--cysteine ligase
MKIILGVTGSISAYKSYDIARNMVKAGHQVKVILTAGALKFLKPETYTYLGIDTVYHPEDDFNLSQTIDNVLHIDLKDWCDLLVIAPASANTIAKLANGQCDDLLSSVFLTAEKKNKIIFPAMNTQMYINTITQDNLKRLKTLENTFIHSPVIGELACGELGIGKLPDPETISEFVDCYPELNLKAENQRKILITTGSTVAPLDPVRYVTNPASGKTGYELTKSYLKKGCNVTLIYGTTSNIPVHNLQEHPNLTLIKASTTQDMFEKVNTAFDDCDVFISSAAVSDIEFEVSDKKLKKSQTEKNIEFNWAKDILGAMVKKKGPKQKIISFAAETNDLKENFSKKWESKPVDLMVGNKVHNGFSGKPLGFGQIKNQYFFIMNGSVEEEKELSKVELSKFITSFTEKNK